ncbi:unnamed protein product [Arctogadus glacialis]
MSGYTDKPGTNVHQLAIYVRPEPNGVVSGAENQAIWPVTALHRHHGLDHLVRWKTTAEWPSEGTTAPGGWTATSVRLTTVTGQETGMRGRKRLAVRVGDREVMHEFWLADIRDSSIIGLDLLTLWGARVDMARAAITVGAETVALQSGRGWHGDSGGRRSSRRAMAWKPRPLPGPCVSRGPVSAAFPSLETAETVNALWLRSGEERAHESPMVAALQTTEAAQTISEAEGWLPLSARQLEQQQRADETLALVRDWLEAGQRPSWPEVSKGQLGFQRPWLY